MTSVLEQEDDRQLIHRRWRLTGLDCPDCARTVATSVEHVEGVVSATLNFASGILEVSLDPLRDSSEEVVDLVRRMDYGIAEPEGATSGGAAVQEERAVWSRMSRSEMSTAVSGMLILAGLVLEWLGFDGWLPTVAFGSAIAVGGAVIARRAIASARIRSLDMNVLMSIAVLGAAGIGEWLEGAMVVFLFSVGGLLETRSIARTRGSIRDLMDLSPATARVVRDGVESVIPPSEVGVGSIAIVRPGERIPLDGRIVRGATAIDESPITGESIPVEKGVGDDVYAGTLNTHGVLEIEVTSGIGDSMLARIVHLVEEAQGQRAPFQRLVDRFTRYYTPSVVLVAVFVATVPPSLSALTSLSLGSFSEWFYRALVLLVVSCPCALVISTPVAVVSAIARATRDGVLVKGGAFLELAPRLDVIAFDKTGTLTMGRPEVVDVVAVASADAEDVLEMAVALERFSNHPLAAAVTRAGSGASGVVVESVSETPGRGVSGRIDGVRVMVGSPSAVADESPFSAEIEQEIARIESDGRTVLVVWSADTGVLGLIGITDMVRPEAAATLSRLRDLGVEHLVMLTGDNERTAAAIAGHVGISEYRAGLSPQDKTDAISELRERYGYVAMVGDGINDAPALARADIGIAMGAAGSDAALESADVALMRDDPAALPAFIKLGRRTVANIRQNVWVSIAIKGVVLVAAVLGYAPLWLAVFADTGVALLVIVNALRLFRGGV